MLYKRVLLILGNSHLNAFRRCFDRLIDRSLVDFEIHYVVSGLLKTPWGDFRENKYLRYLEYENNIAPGLDLTSWRYKIDIVLVGMGMSGSGILVPFAPVRNVPRDEQDRAGDYTPKIPLLEDIDSGNGRKPGHTMPVISEAEARTIYENHYHQKIQKIKNLLVDGKYHQLHWIAEPDMIESVARFRFGEDLVESGLYARHRQIGNSVILKLLTEYEFKDKVIFHPDKYILPSGFVQDRFRPSVLKADHHVSPDFYHYSALQLADRLDLPLSD